MAIKFLNDIDKLDNIQFINGSGANAGLINMDGNDLVLSNPLGDILLGDGASDVYIGDGTNNVDILFEQSGSIKADDSASGVTLTLGSNNTTLAFGGNTSFAGVVTDISGTSANAIDLGTNGVPFRNIYAAHHVGGSSINYATSRGWVEDAAPLSSTQGGFYGGDFVKNGDNAENEVVWGMDPFKNKALLWKAICNTSDSDDDGGWNKDITLPANNNIGYLSYVYFMADFTADSSNDGSVYLGCGTASGQTLNLDGSNNTNPYFASHNFATFNNGGPGMAERWYLIIGIIQPYNNSSTVTNTLSGIYDVETGEKVSSGPEFKMGNNTTGQKHRTYVYYDSSTDNENVYFWNPGFHAIDGSEPKLQDLLKRQIYLNDNIKAVFGDSDDLQIYHDGSNSYIDDFGTGNLKIRSNRLQLEKYTGETMAEFIADGASSLYYDNSKKLETTSVGIDVTGEVQGDSLDIDGNADISGNATFAGDVTVNGGDLTVTSASTNSVINLNGGESFVEKDSGTDFYIANNVSDRDIKFRVKDNGTNVIALTLDGSENGNATFSGNIAVSGTVDGVDIATRDAVLTSTTTTANAALAKTGGTMTGSLVLDDNSGDSPSIQLKNENDVNYQIYNGSSGNFVITRVGNNGADLVLNGSSTDYTSSTLSVGGAEISSTKIGNWNTAYGWGDHSSAGYSTATGVENNADVTDTANVTAAGALMDSEVTNLAQVKAFDSSDYATAAQGTKADNALPKAGGTMTGQLVVNQNAGTLNLVGTDHTYIQWYPAGTSGGRHAYTGFAGSGTDHFTIANETSGAHINLTTNSGTVNVTGNLGVSGTVDGRDVATDGTKLDTIATNADVTPSWVPSSDPSYLTAHPNISAASSVNNSGKTYIQDITLDSNGHVTGLVSDSLTSSDFIEPGSNGALNSLSCGSYTHDTDIAFVLDSDNNETASFIIKDGAGNSPFTLTEAGDLTITGKFISTFASKATAGAILVEDSGEIKKRTTTELKSDLSLNNVPNTDATNASNLSSGTVPTARLATTAIAKGGTGATTASAARAALGVDAAGTDNSTDVTLAGSLNYITISGQEITRNAIDLAADVTGTLPQTNLPDDMDSDKVKQICTTHHNFFMNSSSTTADFFVPFNNLNESSNPTNAQYYNRTVVPYGGRLVKIALHTTAAIGSACKVQFWKTNSTGTFASYTEEVTGIDLNTANSSDTATFSSATFSEGDVVGVSIIKSSSATANMQVTLVWEYTL